MKVLARLFGGKTARAAKVAAQKATEVAKVIGDDLGKTQAANAARTPRIHEEYGEILRMQIRRRGASLPVESVPTRQYIDDMLGVAKLENANVTGGWYNRQRVSDALAGFKSGQHVQPVTIESVPTKEAIEKLNNIARVEQLKRAEALGELTPQMLAKREDMLAALASDTGDFIAPTFVEKVCSGEFKALAKDAKKFLNVENKSADFKKFLG